MIVTMQVLQTTTLPGYRLRLEAQSLTGGKLQYCIVCERCSDLPEACAWTVADSYRSLEASTLHQALAIYSSAANDPQALWA